MRLRLAVFDMVGTTVHAGDEIPSAFREALLSVGVELSDADIAGIRGLSKKDAISDLLRAHGSGEGDDPGLPQLVYQRFQDSLRHAFGSRARALPQALPVFEFLKREGVKVVLATGLDREIASLLFHSLGWDDIGLAGLITGDDVPRGRPAPDLIHAAMRLAEVAEAEAVLAAGDTASDLEAAAAAGVGWSIGVLSGAHAMAQLETHPHSAILESVGDLPAWLSDVGALR